MAGGKSGPSSQREEAPEEGGGGGGLHAGGGAAGRGGRRDGDGYGGGGGAVAAKPSDRKMRKPRKVEEDPEWDFMGPRLPEAEAMRKWPHRYEKENPDDEVDDKTETVRSHSNRRSRAAAVNNQSERVLPPSQSKYVNHRHPMPLPDPYSAYLAQTMNMELYSKMAAFYRQQADDQMAKEIPASNISIGWNL